MSTQTEPANVFDDLREQQFRGVNARTPCSLSSEAIADEDTLIVFRAPSDMPAEFFNDCDIDLDLLDAGEDQLITYNGETFRLSLDLDDFASQCVPLLPSEAGAPLSVAKPFSKCVVVERWIQMPEINLEFAAQPLPGFPSAPPTLCNFGTTPEPAAKRQRTQ
jgi:hypothetical protein